MSDFEVPNKVFFNHLEKKPGLAKIAMVVSSHRYFAEMEKILLWSRPLCIFLPRVLLTTCTSAPTFLTEILLPRQNFIH